MIIAIDGPAASGKGTLARRLANELGYAYLDTGLLYRAVAHTLVKQGSATDDKTAAVAATQSLSPADLDDEDLRSEAVGQAASVVAAIPEVREALLVYQRGFAESPPDGLPGAVIDGRDIGTVVCPDADVKLYVTASLEERAHRRAVELGLGGESDEMMKEVSERDERDRRRDASPMRPAPDAHLLDTTNLAIEAAFDAAKAIINASLNPQD